MGSATDVLNAARSQLGYNGEGDCDSPITTFGEWFGVQTQWCAEFVSWCLAQANVPSLGRFAHGEDYCPAWVSNFKDACRFKLSSPQPGDVVFYNWNLDGVADHVGLVESVGADGSITTIEGNTDDPTLARYACGNCCRRKHRTTTYVLGYGQPAYTPGIHSALSGGATDIGNEEDMPLTSDDIEKVAVRVMQYLAGTVTRISDMHPEVMGSTQRLRDTACAIGGQKSALPDGTKISSIGAALNASNAATAKHVANAQSALLSALTSHTTTITATGQPDLTPILAAINALPKETVAQLAKHLGGAG
jgi:hypothetical protein